MNVPAWSFAMGVSSALGANVLYAALPLKVHAVGAAPSDSVIVVPHVPVAHTLPQPLQLAGSLVGSTHWPIHNSRPPSHGFGAASAASMEEASCGGLVASVPVGTASAAESVAASGSGNSPGPASGVPTVRPSRESTPQPASPSAAAIRRAPP